MPGGAWIDNLQELDPNRPPNIVVRGFVCLQDVFGVDSGSRMT